MLKFTVIIVTGIVLGVNAERQEIRTIEWTGGSFNWPCETTKHLYKMGGRYISKNIIATRAVMAKDEIIVALPRFRPGVPATLAKLPLKNKLGMQPLLEPFPSWSLQEEANCAALQNAVDVFIDSRGILWVLDIGVVNSLEQPTRTCAPKVVALNSKSGKVVKIIELDNLASPSSRLQYVMADYTRDARVFVYVTDAASRAILVSDVTSGRGYRMILPNIVTSGCDRLDVLYAVLLRYSDGSSDLVFTYLGSDRIFSLRTNRVQSNVNGTNKIRDLGSKPKKMVFLGTDNGSVMFFRYAGENEVYRWDTTKSCTINNFQKVYTGSECSLATQAMADTRQRSRLRILQSNFPDFIQGTVGCGAEHSIVPL